MLINSIDMQENKNWKRKNKKLLSALIATSLVGIITTPIVLTSCSKKIVLTKFYLVINYG